MKKILHHKKILHVLAILFLGALVYSNTLHAPFVFDDARYIVTNPAIQDMQYFQHPSRVKSIVLLPELKHAFRTRILGHFAFALNYKLNGLDVTGYHMVNIAIHLLNALLVYGLILLTFRTPFFSARTKAKVVFDVRQYSHIIALFSALLFVSHPLQTQAVTYITQRFASLAAFFYLLSVVTYIQSRITQKTSVKVVSYAVALTSAILAMLTKEISFTLPAVIALHEFMFFDGKLKRRIIALIPLFLTMAIIPMSLLAATGSGGDVGGLSESMRKLAISHDVSRWEYLVTQFRVIMTYLRLLIFPVNQNLYYDYPLYRSLFIPSVFLSFLFILTVFISSVYFLYRSLNTGSEEKYHFRLLSFGILWFFMTLSMESSIIPIKDVIFEHRVYLPSPGIFMAFTILLLMLIKRLRGSDAAVTNAAIPALLVIVLLFSGTSYARNSVWKNEISLWEDVVKKSPAMAYNHSELALAYDKAGRIEDAIREYQITIQLDPDQNPLPYNNLGLNLMKQGRTEEAIEAYKNSIRISPDYYKAHMNLGVVYFSLGLMEEAIERYTIATLLKPEYDVAHFNLGLAYIQQERTEEAIQEYQEAIKINPGFQEAHYQLGLVYTIQGRPEAAASEFQTVLKLNPNHMDARRNFESIMRRTR